MGGLQGGFSNLEFSHTSLGPAIDTAQCVPSLPCSCLTSPSLPHSPVKISSWCPTSWLQSNPLATGDPSFCLPLATAQRMLAVRSLLKRTQTRRRRRMEVGRKEVSPDWLLGKRRETTGDLLG